MQYWQDGEIRGRASESFKKSIRWFFSVIIVFPPKTKAYNKLTYYLNMPGNVSGSGESRDEKNFFEKIVIVFEGKNLFSAVEIAFVIAILMN